MKKLLILLAVIGLTACGNNEQKNDKLRYGSSGYPSNCRALITEIVRDHYHEHKYTTDDQMASLWRNCGADGQLWDK